MQRKLNTRRFIAGAVAVPLIIGRALSLPPQQIAVLINADLFACGIATLIQSVGFPGVGIRLPVMMGVTFASVAPMLAMAGNPEIGLLGIYGAVIVGGVFGLVVAPFISRMLPLFPPVVTGTIIIVIGISLMRVGINWAGGGLPTLARNVEGQMGQFPNPNYGALDGLGIALFVLLVILAITKYGKGFLSNVAVLLGIVAGAIVAAFLGKMHFDKVASASWFGVVYPFQFGLPTFDLVASLTMCLVMIVVMIESVGMFLALVGRSFRKISCQGVRKRTPAPPPYAGKNDCDPEKDDRKTVGQSRHRSLRTLGCFNQTHNPSVSTFGRAARNAI